MSWKGYGPDDDTYEPAENLTGCDEILRDFFVKRLEARSKAKTPQELSELLLPTHDCVKDLLRETFVTYMFRPTEEHYSNAVITLNLPKPPKIKSENEIYGDIDKLVAMRDPQGERYVKLLLSILEQLTLKETLKLRAKQLAELREWERNINKICSDPVPLQVENTVDLAKPPTNFIYINDYLPGKGISIPKDPLAGCECSDCYLNQKSCCAHQMNSYFAYTKYAKLRVSLGTAIYECNKLCKCPPDCNNRVVQRGRMVKLCIFRTNNNRGWGVKALEYIKKDSFVTEYVGEVISSEEAEKRGHVYDAQGCTYLFDLDYNKGDLNPYTVDAAKYGNVSHFINHSCDPNLVVFNVWINCLDPDLPKLALFATRDIRKGEELTFDYNSSSVKPNNIVDPDLISLDENNIPKTPSKLSNSDETLTPNKNKRTPKSRMQDGGKTACRCGAANCRGFFF